jgi:hypothetical protein
VTIALKKRTALSVCLIIPVLLQTFGSQRSPPIEMILPFRSAFLHRPAVLFLILSLAMVFNAVAQKPGFGPKLGGNLSMFRGNFQASGMQKIKPGFAIGAYLNFKFAKNKKWQFEINGIYSTRGHKAKFYNTFDFDETNDERENAYQYNIGYLEFPFLFKYMLNRGGITRPHLFFGPTYSGIMNAKFTDLNSKFNIDAKEWIKRDDFGLTVGWGISWFFVNHWYHIDVRYYHGFINVSDNLRDDLGQFIATGKGSDQIISKYYNSTLAVTFGISLERPNQYFLRSK